jgi:hypothetical protein
MGYNVMFQCFYTLHNDQLRILKLFLISNMYHFFVIRTFKILSSNYFE